MQNPILNECQARDPNGTGFLTFQEFKEAILAILPLNPDELKMAVRYVQAPDGNVEYGTAVGVLDI